MKTLRFISCAMIIALAFASCGTEKKSEKKAYKDFPTWFENLPCYTESMETLSEFRAIGYGIDPDVDKAKIQAIKNAKEELIIRMRTAVSATLKKHVIESSYTQEELKRAEDDINQQMEGLLERMGNPCWDRRLNPKDIQYYYIYVGSINKQDLDALVNKVLNKK